MSAATIASLRSAAEAQKASAERALQTLATIEATHGDDATLASHDELARLASTVADELGDVMETWRGAAADGDRDKPRTMAGVGLMMGGLSLGELKGAIASRPSKNTDGEDAAPKHLEKIGVRVVPAMTPTAPEGGGGGGKPAWMLELEEKKRAKAASERQIG
jgi:hypothetical protein